jgi:hypothetical protein
MQRCPRLRMIQVQRSYRKTMSNAIQVFLEMQGVEMLEGDVWIQRKARIGSELIKYIAKTKITA